MTADSWALEAALGLGLGWGETWSQELCLEAEIT